MAACGLRREIRIFLFGNEREFEAEKAILHNVVAPQLRRFCIETLHTDLVLVDPNFTYPGVRLPKRSVDEWKLDCDACFSVSEGPSAVVLIGEKYGGPKLPQQLSEQEYQGFLGALKRRNDPLWTSLQKSYAKQGDVMKLQPLAPEAAEALLQRMTELQAEAAREAGLQPCHVEALFTPPLEAMLRHLKTKPADQCLTFARVLKDVADWGATEDKELKEEFLDLDSFGRFNAASNEQLQQEREEFLQRLPKENYVRFSISSTMLAEYKSVVRLRSNLVSKLAETQLAAKDVKATTYLTIFAKQTFDKLRNHVLKFYGKKEFLGLPLQREVETHELLFASYRPRQPAAYSRDREVKILQNYVASKSQLPGLIFGDHGCGKSTLLKLVLDSVKEETTIIIKRSCGKTPASATLQQVISSITEEIHFHTKGKFLGSCEYAQVVYDFVRALQQVNTRKQLLIVMDGIDVLYPQSHTELFRWLPHRLPPGVKVLLTASSESFLTNFKRRFDDSSSLSLPGLATTTVVKEFPNLLAARGKTLGERNRELANSLLQNNSYPLFPQILADLLPCREEKLPDRVKLLFMKRIEQLEQKHGQWAARSVLSYLSCARFGLSLPELQDVLSLDNAVVQESGFDAKSSNFFRVPTAILTPLLEDVAHYLVAVRLDNHFVLTWAHEVLRSAVVDFYQLNKEQGQQVQQQLAEFWSGRWAGAKAKPLFEKSADGDDSKSVNVDRLVLHQPFAWKDSLSNNRKICELPHSLLKAEKISELYRSCLFSFEYLYAKVSVSSVNDLISECYFLRQNYEVRANPELEVLISLLRLLAPIVEKNLSLLGAELSGRLCHLAGSQILITALLQQIDGQGSRVNCLCPALPAFPPVEVDEIKVPLPNPEERPVLCALSPDNRFLATLFIIEEEIFMYVWDAKSATKSQILSLGPHDGSRFLRIGYMPQTDELMLLEYRRRCGDREFNGFYFLNLSTASMETKLEFRLSEKPKIVFLTKSYVTLRVDGKYKVYQYSSAEPAPEFRNLHWPFLITQNDKYAISPKAWKSDSGKMDTNLRMVNTTSGDQVCVISCHLYATCLLANSRNDFLYVGCKNLGLVFRYDIAQAVKRDLKKLSPSVELNLEKQNIGDEFRNLFSKYKTLTSVTKLMQSIDEKYLVVEYNVNEIRTVMAVWSVAQKSVQCVLPQAPNSVTRFSVDGAHVYQFCPHSDTDSSVRLFNCSSGELVQQVEVGEPVQDLYVIKDRLALLVTQSRVTLSALKAMAARISQSETQVAHYGTSLREPFFNSDLNILYDNNPNACDFTFINLDNGGYQTFDLTHESDVIGQCPAQRRLTPDGDKLLLVFGAKKQSGRGQSRQQVDWCRQPAASLRKPELPSTNYFTGVPVEATSHQPTVLVSGGDSPYGQLIIRVYDTDTGRIVSQISVTGETVSHVTAKLLLTTRPDHASRTRDSPDASDIISVYDLQSGQFLRQVFLQHRIIASKLVDANRRLLVCCGRAGCLVESLGGEFFDQIHHQVDVGALLKAIDEYARSPVVKDMLVPEDSSHTVLLHFFIKETEIQYAKVDIQKQSVVASFTAHDFIKDITRDGRFGIDRGLRLYDLSRGELLKQFSLASNYDFQHLDTTPRFIGDGSLIVVLDNALGELCVLRNDQSSEVVGKVILHRLLTDRQREESKEQFQLTVGHTGKVALVHTSAEFKVFVVRDEHLRGKRPQEQVYHSVADRCRFLSGHRRHNSLDSLFAKRLGAGADPERDEERARRAKKGRSPKVAHKSPVEKGTPTRR